MYTLENGAMFSTLDELLHYARTKRDSGIDMTEIEKLLADEAEKGLSDEA